MQQSLPVMGPDVHGATSSTVKSLMEKNIIPIDTFVQTFLHTILIGTEHRDSQVADAWIGCLLEIIPLLSLSVLQKEVTPAILKKTLHEKPLFQRVSSCRIIGALCKKYPTPVLKRELLPVVLTLCQDVHADVRSEMACYLPVVFQSLESEVVEQLLMPMVVDLASEEIIKVKEATFLAIVNSLQFYTPISLKTTIIPLLKQLFEFALNDNTLLLSVAENFGIILSQIERIIHETEKDYFLNYYLSVFEKASEKQRWLLKPDDTASKLIPRLPSDIAVLFRKHCARNYAAVVKLAYNDNSRVELDSLHKIVKNLVSDHYWDVRKIIAASFSEILANYGRYKLLLKDEFLKLLNDDIDDVLASLIPTLAVVLVDFAKLDAFSNDQQEPLNSKLFKALKHCENMLSTTLNWRLQCSFIQQMEVMWYIFPTNVVYQQFISTYLQRILQTRVLPLRLAYVRALLINAKFLPNSSHQNEVKVKLRELSANQSFYNRVLFVRSCSIIMDIYSTAYFKENFFMDTVKLSSDPVPNIRWGLCKLLPELRNMLKLPKDKSLLKALKTCVQQIESDQDKEVQIMFKSVKSRLDAPDEKAFPNDKVKEVEEKMLNSLNPKLVQLFPSSVMHMFDPLASSSVLAPNIVQKIESSSSYIEQSAGAMNNISLSTSKEISPKDSGFSDQEFLVDAGVLLNTFDKSYSSSNIPNNESSFLKNNHVQAIPTVKTFINCENSNHTESKLLQKKKAGFKQSIPVRKKSSLPEPEVAKRETPVDLRRHSQQLDRTKPFKNDLEEKRRNQIVRQPEKRYSLDVMATHKKITFEINTTDRMHNLGVTDKEENIVHLKDNTQQNTSSVDINKNVTKKSTITTQSDTPSVQRRKKSQLPRPLSCVVLPSKNNLEKPLPVSKLPIMRRS